MLAGVGRPRSGWARHTEVPLLVASVLFFLAYAWPILQPDLADGWVSACSAVLAVVWLMFVVDYLVRLSQAENRGRWVRRHPFDVLVLVLPMLRPLMFLGLLARLTATGRSKGARLRGRLGWYLAGGVVMVVVLGALTELKVERGHGDIDTFGESVWWACATLTTTGYGDLIPVTAPGRVVAVGLMVGGIVTMGIVTGILSSWLIQKATEASDGRAEDSERASGGHSAGGRPDSE